MYRLGAILGQQPVAIAGTLRSVLYVLILAGVLNWDAAMVAGVALAAEAVLGLFVWHAVTPTVSPTLAADTEVKVEGTTDSVIIAASPPGPTGIEGGAQ